MVQWRSSSSSRWRVSQAVVQFVEMLLRLGDQAVQAGDGLARDLAVQELAKLDLLAVDEGVEADFDVPGDALHFVRTRFRGRRRPSTAAERLLVQELLDAAWRSGSGRSPPAPLPSGRG